MTAELLRLADWRQAAGWAPAAMARTGADGRPASHLLAGLGPRLVVKAPPITAGPGRKTEVKDAAWTAALLRHGRWRGRFMPAKPQRQLRELARHRPPLVPDRARVIPRLQAVLGGANTQLAAGVTAIRGVPARARLGARLVGERDVTVLAG